MTDLIQLEKRHLWHPFTPMQAWCAEEHEPLMLVSGQGCTLKDQHGNEYLDGNSSIWTNIHGHAHPTITAAIHAQLDRVAHTSFLGFTHEPAVELGKQLVDLLPGSALSRVFFSDNGSTAIESAMRMALQFWKQNNHAERDTILAFDRAYHGDTLGAASVGGIPIFKGSGNDFGYRVQRVPNFAALELLTAEQTSRLAAVIIEPLIQGSAGMRLWPKGMLAQLSAWCRERDIFLILDEVMTGFGRTGTMFACQQEGVVPDFLCLAKGLTGGYLPLAATMTTERVFEGFLGAGRAFYYGHSYTANQLGCAAALGSLRVFREESVMQLLPAKIALLTKLLDELRDLPQVMEIRQCGLMAGIEIGPYAPEEMRGAKVCLAAWQHGLLTRPVQDTLVLMPPLSVTESELTRMVQALRAAMEDRPAPSSADKHKSMSCYLDANATTPVDARVVEAMLPFLTQHWGNPSASHEAGRRARRAVEKARRQVAAMVGADAQEIVFTSGATESINSVLHFAQQEWPERPLLIISAVEHAAVMDGAERWERQGGRVKRIPVDADGLVKLDLLKAALELGQTALVSMIWANNETGVISPMAEIVSLAHAAGALVHVDAVQMAGKLPIDVVNLQADYLSLSAHKMYGVKGCGALFVSRRVPFRPLLIGGGQESDRRSGTENVPGIVAMGKAAELVDLKSPVDLSVMRDAFEKKLMQGWPTAIIHGVSAPRLPNTTSVCLPGVDAAGMLILLDQRGIACSGGSACHTASLHPSHVLEALGYDAAHASSTLRFSLSQMNSPDEVLFAADEVIRAAKHIRDQRDVIDSPVLMS
ncbi:MAG: adenosylmethionine--8-amino-7-oxononanoate transaminase [Verrucomicrobia bacterium]|nr:adenosylmethionine--8-amino-7-oxononanoate transaminase [Verrucomicrobiota bacterium]